jgi:hypothetical protein
MTHADDQMQQPQYALIFHSMEKHEKQMTLLDTEPSQC